MPQSRRRFLTLAATAGATAILPSRAALTAKENQHPSLSGEVGLTAATLARHQSHRASSAGAIAFNDLPRIIRQELDMRVIDLNTMNFPDFKPKTLDDFRAAADNADCILTNLKLNQPEVSIGSPDPEIRRRGLATYKESVDHAARLGLRWVRPLPRKQKPDIALLADSLRALADYAGERGVTVLIENFGWMMSDPDSVIDLIEKIDRGLPASPDTGNWTDNEVRYEGLRKTFPLAATCDFKAKTMGPNGEHKLYDLERCFQIGWDAGFHGPWCIEHGNADRKALFRELGIIRDKLRGWIAHHG